MRALDYLRSQYLAERGYKALHMGGSRPFLLDGVLRHKRELKVRLSDHTKRIFSLNLTASSAGAKAFIANNPFIYENKGTYRGAIFIEPDLPLSQERLRELYDEIPYGGTGRSFAVRCPRWRRETARADFSEGSLDSGSSVQHGSGQSEPAAGTRLGIQVSRDEPRW